MARVAAKTQAKNIGMMAENRSDKESSRMKAPEAELKEICSAGSATVADSSVFPNLDESPRKSDMFAAVQDIGSEAELA